MERLHNGSEEEGWQKEDGEKILSEEECRQEGRSQEDSEKESDQEAPLAPPVRTKKKAGNLPAFFFRHACVGHSAHHLE